MSFLNCRILPIHHFLVFFPLLLITACGTTNLADLRANGIHQSQTVNGNYQALGVCLARWLDENTASQRLTRDYPSDSLFQIQGPRGSAGRGFATLVELRQIGSDSVTFDTYVARDMILFSSETITERFHRGLATCV